MSDIQILSGRLNRELLVTMPGRIEGHLKLSIPEFYGKSGQAPFAINQVLNWDTRDAGDVAAFALDTLPSDLGLDFHGEARIEGPDELAIECSVTNVQSSAVDDAHHTILADFTTAPAFADETGDRTYVYTNDGWISLAGLQADAPRDTPSVWVGAARGPHTAIWRVLARVDLSGKLVAAVAWDRGYVFSSDHPDWPPGLLVGCRWGTLAPDETAESRGKVYLFQGSLDDLRDRYARDFRTP